MAALAAVSWLTRRHLQSFRHQAEVQVKQKAAVKEQRVPLSPLSIAADLEALNGEIGVALQFDRDIQHSLKRVPISTQNKPICGMNACQRSRLLEAQDQRVIEAAGALKHCAAAGTPAQDRDALFFAVLDVYLCGNSVGVTNDNKVLCGLPKPEDFGARTLIDQVQQRLITSQILGRGVVGDVATMHSERLDPCCTRASGIAANYPVPLIRCYSYL